MSPGTLNMVSAKTNKTSNFCNSNNGSPARTWRFGFVLMLVTLLAICCNGHQIGALSFRVSCEKGTWRALRAREWNTTLHFGPDDAKGSSTAKARDAAELVETRDFGAYHGPNTIQSARPLKRHDSGLFRRSAWQDSVERGCTLVKLMGTPNAELEAKLKARATSYTDTDVMKSGYQVTVGQINSDEKTSLKTVLESGILGATIPVSTLDESEIWQKYTYEQVNAYTGLDGQQYEPIADVKFSNLYSPKYKVIVASDNHSPVAQQPSLRDTPERLPLLSRWSDIIWHDWTSLCKSQSYLESNLKAIIRLNVVADDTGDVIRHITGGPLDSTLKGFDDAVVVPGVPNSEDALAMIGNPNGSGVAWTLIQHKEVLGDTKTIESVRFWDSAEGEKSGIPDLDGIPNILYMF